MVGSRTITTIGLMLFLACAVAGLLLLRRPRADAVDQVHTQPAVQPTQTAAEPLTPTRVTPVPSSEVFSVNTLNPGLVAPSNRSVPGRRSPIINAPANSGSAPATDELARAALSYVGADPDAEAYWYSAINDPKLPAEERQNLIEDLNEDGLSDPKHPGPEDLPLIVNRILLIENLAPDAMDKVNADAFQEAYKDLLNLADVAVGGGEPVK